MISGTMMLGKACPHTAPPERVALDARRRDIFLAQLVDHEAARHARDIGERIVAEVPAPALRSRVPKICPRGTWHVTQLILLRARGPLHALPAKASSNSCTTAEVPARRHARRRGQSMRGVHAAEPRRVCLRVTLRALSARQPLGRRLPARHDRLQPRAEARCEQSARGLGLRVERFSAKRTQRGRGRLLRKRGRRVAPGNE